MPRCGPLLDQKEDLFLGRVMVAWEPLRAALTRGGSEQATDRVALLRAVTDWYRVHMPRLLSADILTLPLPGLPSRTNRRWRRQPCLRRRVRMMPSNGPRLRLPLTVPG